MNMAKHIFCPASERFGGADFQTGSIAAIIAIITPLGV